MEEKIRKYMEESFLFEFGDEITADTNLFAEGVMDSFGYVQLMAFLEEEFGVSFAEQEMLANIEVTLNRIVASVARKIAEKQ